MTTRVYVPVDSTAIALGANATAAALAVQASIYGYPVEVLRNGSRGMFWLEPLIEVETPQGRVGYGPVSAADLPELLAAGMLQGAPHPKCIGLVDEHDYLKRQERLTFARVGITVPTSLDDYRAHGGYEGLANAIAMPPAQIVAEVTESGLRGRGGAAFPTGIKWKTVFDQPPQQKYIVCNADEGDSGTYSDRMLMEGDPFVLIEGMTIAGLAVGATMGYIYLRCEYPHAALALNAAINNARAAGFLGPDVCGSGRAFELEVRMGAGAYICGEETSLLESLEGKRGMVRVKPPLPAIKGLFGQPTVVNNVVSLCSVPIILAKGGAFYRDFGMGRSRGTLPFQLAGNVRYAGLVEKAFGLSLGELVDGFGGGTLTGRPVRAVQVGGPLGAYMPYASFDTPLDYEAFSAKQAMIGHGGVVVFDDTVDMAEQARYAMEFCSVESCGKCTPCRIGSTRGREVIEKVMAGVQVDANLALLEDLCNTMLAGSLCALGGMVPYPVMSALRFFPEDFRRARRAA